MLHAVHKVALQNVKGVVDCGMPYSLQQREERRKQKQQRQHSASPQRDGRRAIAEAQKAAIVDAENARMGAKLRAIYLRDARALRHPGNGKSQSKDAPVLGNDTRQLARSVMREQHMEDPELDRLRRHTQQCFDQRRLARAEATLAENAHFAARLAAVPPLVGSLRAAAEYDTIAAQRVALRSRFKIAEDHAAKEEARRARQQRLLARRAARLENQEDDEAAWMFEQGGQAALDAFKESQNESLEQYLRSPSRLRSATATPAQRPGSANMLRPTSALASASASKSLSKDGSSADVHHLLLSTFSSTKDRQRSRSRSGSRSRSLSRSPSKTTNRATAADGTEEAKEQQLEHDPTSGGSSPARRSSSSSANALISRSLDGRLTRPPSMAAREADMDAQRKGRAKTATKQRGLSSSKSQGVLLAARPATAAAFMQHSSSSSSLFFSPTTVAGTQHDDLGGLSAEEQLVRDAAAIESALAARKRTEARSGSAGLSPLRQRQQQQRQDHSPSRPSTAAILGGYYSRPTPSPSAPASKQLARALRPRTAFDGLHSHDRAGVPRVTSLKEFMEAGRAGFGGGVDALDPVQQHMSTTAPLANPEVEAALQAILDEHNLHIETLEPLPSIFPRQAPPPEPVAEAARRRAAGHAKNKAARGSVMLNEPDRQSFYADNAAEVLAARQAVLANAVAASYVAAAGSPVPPRVKSSQVPTIASTLGLLAKVNETAALESTETAEATPTKAAAKSAAKASSKSKSAAADPSATATPSSVSGAAAAPAPLWAEDDDESEIAPPARPWSSPVPLPKLAFKAAIAAETAANAADQDVPHAAPPAEGEAAAAEAAATAEEEKWRGKLDWAEAEAEVPTPHIDLDAVAAEAAADAAAEAAAGDAPQESSLWDSVPLSTEHSVNDLRLLLRGQNDALAAAAAAARTGAGKGGGAGRGLASSKSHGHLLSASPNGTNSPARGGSRRPSTSAPGNSPAPASSSKKSAASKATTAAWV